MGIPAFHIHEFAIIAICTDSYLKGLEIAGMKMQVLRIKGIKPKGTYLCQSF